MKVYFKNSWFSPNSTRYRKGRSYEIPDEWADQLNEKSTEILEDNEPGEAIELDLLEKKQQRRRKVKAKVEAKALAKE